jgi:hypothetical protein
MSGQLHAPAALPPGERAQDIHWIEGWVDPRTGLGNLEKRKFLTLPGLELQPLGHLACKSVTIPTTLSRLPEERVQYAVILSGTGYP